ncbi:hypothetical protein COY07_06125 [Candidatus Peregrinibacteria bacterium CG_4_10_14_0_2_um_filter_43_11]|nr:MAG: hypothetical protein COY07_06125 [Candidatus Peregrinibacteria bacterium CG_4_10_14_0_2_um_filter_43_11]
MAKKSTQWITIPEEVIHTPVSPVAGKRSSSRVKDSSSAVQHKSLWAVGFVVVFVASFAMLAPHQFSSILQGNLFDAPGVTNSTVDQSVNPLNVLPAKTVEQKQEEAVVIPSETVPDQLVVQPETSAVSIQVAPLSPPVETAIAEPAKVLTPNEKLLQELSQQVADLKEGNQVAVTLPVTAFPATSALSIPPSSTGLHSSATEAANTTVLLGQPSIQPGYKINSHTVTLHPQIVLQQNLGRGMVSASAVSVPQPSYQSQAYNANLSRAQGTPESGPSEVLMIAFLLTFASLIGWKGFKLFGRT